MIDKGPKSTWLLISFNESLILACHSYLVFALCPNFIGGGGEKYLENAILMQQSRMHLTHQTTRAGSIPIGRHTVMRLSSILVTFQSTEAHPKKEWPKYLPSFQDKSRKIGCFYWCINNISIKVRVIHSRHLFSLNHWSSLSRICCSKGWAIFHYWSIALTVGSCLLNSER